MVEILWFAEWFVVTAFFVILADSQYDNKYADVQRLNLESGGMYFKQKLPVWYLVLVLVTQFTQIFV